MNKITRALSFLVALVLLIPVAQGATYLVPSDAEMIQQSDDIVIARAISSRAERDSRGAIVTRYVLEVDQVMKGHRAAGEQFVVTERGGSIGDKYELVPGTPVYLQGEKYVAFTTRNEGDDETTYGMALGQFLVVADGNRWLAVRHGISGLNQNLETHDERLRDLGLFLDYVGNITRNRFSSASYFVTRPPLPATQAKIESLATRGSYLQLGFGSPSSGCQSGCPFRWSTPAYGFVKSGVPQPPTVSGAGALAAAIGQWNSSGTSISLTDDGTNNAALGGLGAEDGERAILFNDPNGDVSPPVIGIAQIRGNSTYTNVPGDPTRYIDMGEVDIVMDNIAWSQCLLDVATTHEVGHTLGFRHSNQDQSGGTCGGALDCSGSAIMNSSVGCGVTSLRQWDLDAANTVYGAGPVCTPASITTPPVNRNISIGQSTSLSVAAGGSAPITYAWFVGTTGTTSQPAGNTASINVSPTETTSYWVRVSNACNTSPVDSGTVTVTVTCANPAISSPLSGANITEGMQATLQVVATGSGLTYQWFQGAAGITTTPVGGNSPSLTVTPATTTQYWVRVSGTCGSPVDSNAATVNVTPCGDVEVQLPTATPNPGIGNYRLNVNAFSSSTPLQFQWFRGNTPGAGGTLIGSTQAVNVTVTAVTSFWARVSNACGKSAFSNLITVAPCTLPSIATQPEDKSIVTGNTATLTVAVDGSGSTVKWYRGAVGDRANEVGNTASVTVGPLFETTAYWAEVTNSCGSVSSRAVTVTVDPATTNLFLLNRRFNVQVRYRNQFANPPAEGLLTGKSLQASTLSDTAIFWFDSPLVVELMVRVSDARPFDNAFHIYLGGLSDVEFFITVKDTVTGKSVEYHKLGNSLVGQIDRKSFPTGSSLNEALDAMIAGNTPFRAAPNADETTLRMLDRYDVRVRYRNQFASPAAVGYLLGRSITKVSTTETAVFYFENPESVEWIVRFSDVRPFANRIDFFHGGLSDVEYTVEVKDTQTGQERSYAVAPFSLKGGVDRQSYTP
jgi:hypothetical protein